MFTLVRLFHHPKLNATPAPFRTSARILAEGFPLNVGHVEVEVPSDGSLKSRNDWQVVCEFRASSRGFCVNIKPTITVYAPYEIVSDDFVVLANDNRPFPPPPRFTATLSGYPSTTTPHYCGNQCGVNNSSPL